MKRFLISLWLILSAPVIADKTCSYESYQWNTITKRAENRQRVEKPYFDLNDDEIDRQTGCTVCREDQVWLKLDGVKPALVCHRLHGRFMDSLKNAVQQGFVVTELEGYRVGKTRGEVDASGRRVKFSNHSFGIALDVNTASNGLYENCIEFGSGCRLLRGGEWDPDNNPRSINQSGPLVRAMRAAGLKWGGNIVGRQKDFMHFSITGY